MVRQYVITEDEVKEVNEQLRKIRENALMTRDAGDTETSKTFFDMANGYARCLKALGILRAK